MWRGGIKPLPTKLWLAQVTELLDSCEIMPASTQDKAVRRAFHLAQLSPYILRELVVPALTLDELENMLDAGASERAAAAIVGENASVQYIRGPPGLHAVRFTIGSDTPVHFAAASPALTIIGGWAKFLLKDRKP